MGIKEIVRGFLLADVQTATSSTVVKSPLGESVKSLTTNPILKKIGANEYIKFGTNDDIPEVLEALKGKSSTHAGIISKKSKMVAGEKLDYGGKRTSQNGSKNIEWTVFRDNAGGYNITLDTVFREMAFIYEEQGAVGLVVTKEGVNLVKLEAVTPRKLRAAAPENGVVTKWVKRDVFKNTSSRVFSNEEELINVYTIDNKDDRQIIYIANPESDNDFYGLPNYIGAFNFIEADYEFGVTIKNSAENGFSPKVLATFIGRNVSEDQKTSQANKFKNNFQGSDREQVILSWVRRKEDTPEFKSLDISGLDKTIDVMARLNDSKILTAHSVTNPTLFGVTIAGKLGNSGTELESAYNIFRATETLPTRELLLDGLRTAFKGSQFDDIELTVIDPSVSADELRGGDTTDTEDTTKKE